VCSICQRGILLLGRRPSSSLMRARGVNRLVPGSLCSGPSWASSSPRAVAKRRREGWRAAATSEANRGEVSGWRNEWGEAKRSSY
jgi:hypothetical protein